MHDILVYMKNLKDKLILGLAAIVAILLIIIKVVSSKLQRSKIEVEHIKDKVEADKLIDDARRAKDEADSYADIRRRLVNKWRG